jgi:hypothetical protein
MGMKFSEEFGGSFLKEVDLKGRQVQLTIESFDKRDIGEDKGKLVLSFVGTDKQLVCNKTKIAVLLTLFGDDMDNMVGKKVTLSPGMTTYMGAPTKCINLTGVQAPAPLPVSEAADCPF